MRNKTPQLRTLCSGDLLERKFLGDPVAQPRPRATVVRGRARIYNPTTTRAYKDQIVLLFIQAGELFPEGVPVRVTIDYFFSRPKSLQRKKDLKGIIWHTKKPDLDNLNKAVLDAIGAAGLWHDDRQVVDLRSKKFYTKKGEGPMVMITVEELRKFLL